MRRCAACPVPAGSPCDGALCLHAGHPAWDRHIVGRARLLGDRPGPDPRPAGRPAALAIRAHLDNYTGYGQLAGALAVHLDRIGVAAALAPTGSDAGRVALDPEVAALVDPAAAAACTGELLVAPPDAAPAGGRPTAHLTMWESSRLLPRQAANLSAAAVVAVPCRWCARSFAASGVTAPIRVVPLGIDPAAFRPAPPPAGPFTFACAARLAHGGVRKGVAELARAFVAAFPPGDDVRLRLKLWWDCKPDLPPDPRIEVERGDLTPGQFADWLAGCHCYASLSRAEGWGLVVQQAMALGRPAIVVPYSGVLDYWDESCGWGVPFVEAPAADFYAGSEGSWAVPDFDGAVAALRAARRDRDAVEDKGARAAAAAARFTWARSARVLRGVLAEFGVASPPNEYLAAAWRVHGCPDLVAASDCGCGRNRCARGRGDGGVVALRDCRECLGITQ